MSRPRGSKTRRGEANAFDVELEVREYLRRVAENFRCERLERNMSVKTLAKAAGMNPATIFYFERGLDHYQSPRQNIGIKTLFKMARAMDRTLYELLP